MKTVSILTISDLADFSNVVHHSVWSTWQGAHDHATETVIPKLIAAQDEYGMGDTYDVDICQMEVFE